MAKEKKLGIRPELENFRKLIEEKIEKAKKI